MAKKKVHELAKEMGITSKDITELLELEGIKKTPSSGLEENEEALIKNKLGKATPKAEAPAKVEKTAKTEAPKTEAPKTEIPKKEGQAAPKKKSSMTFVFNAQNSSQGMGGRRPQGQGNKNDGNRQGHNKPNSGAPASAGIIRPRDKSERTILSASMRNLEPETPEVVEEVVETPVVETKPQVDNKPKNNETERREDRKPKNDGERRDDRRPKNDGDRRGFDRNGGGARNDNQGNQRNSSNGQQGRGFDKGSSNGAERNRGGDRFNQNRQGQSNGKPGPGRSAQSAPQAPAAEISAKAGRDNNRKGHGQNNNNNKQYDKKGSKKQENLLNLEKQTGHKKRNATPQAPVQEDPTEIKTLTLPEKISIKELADRMKKQASDIVKKLFMKGQMVTVNQEVSFEEAEEIALEFNYICEKEEKVDVIAELLKEDEEDETKLKKRPPVVCVMGHVDHGKTSLLDAIRHTKVTDKEAGGITQAIGAYQVEEQGQLITFLDTPGHEAFTAMRMRGANSTDIAILVVAADDGVMPQTKEAISHAKAAGVEIIVAINKIDKPAANIEKVKQELSEYELIPEDWGGSTVFCPVSAHTKEGIDNLLDMILLTADVMELKANPKRNARGLVIEAELDKGRGAVATILVQKGTLKVGQPIACGASHGKVRAMLDENGRNVKEAGPSTPVAILGLDNVPDAGETFMAFDTDKEAKAFADTYISESKNKLIEETKAKMSLTELFSKIQEGTLKELNIIVKADVQGSVEAVRTSLTKLSNDEVIVKVIHGGVGAVNESDVILASASNAIIIAFNVRPDPQAKATAEREGVDVRLYKVIYNAIEDVEAAMKGMLDPVFEEKIIGHAQVRQVFKASGVGNIAGSYILDGMFERGCKVRLTREGEQLCDVNLASLKRFKDDVKEVKAGFECGLVLDGWSDIQEEDMIEAYKMVEVPR